MGIARFFGYDADYKRDAAVLSADAIRESVLAFNKKHGRDSVESVLLDESYLAMEPIRLQTFVFKSVNLEPFHYHSNSAEFPDCDDFASIAKSQAVIGAIKNGLSFAPCFMIVNYRSIRRGHHAANLAIDHKGKIWLYEPQVSQWSSSLGDIDHVIGIQA